MAVPMTSCMSLPMMATSVQSQSPILTLVGYLAWQTWVLIIIQCVGTLGVTADLRPILKTTTLAATRTLGLEI